MRLTDNLSLSRVDYNSYNIIEKRCDYRFRYKDILAELTVALGIKAYTKELSMPVMNFGYEVALEKWDNRDQGFCWIPEHDPADGKSTKRYIDDPVSRNIIFRFVKKRLVLFLKKQKPSIIVRGPLSQQQSALSRYRQIDYLLLSMGYVKKEEVCKNHKSLYESYAKREQKEDGVFWFYFKSKAIEDSINELLVEE